MLLDQEAAPEAICFVARTHHDLDFYERRLKEVCPTIHNIKPNEPDDSSSPGLRTATIHRVKGLEFNHVIIVARDTAHEADEATQQDRALLYVAATRARRSLLVCRIMD
jgi:superfamily I DNA/RNA helicase